MRNGSTLRKLLALPRRLFRKIFPTAQQKAFKKWIKDDALEMLRFDFPLEKDSIVLDLGGYKGQWASDIFAMYQCQIHVFEPAKFFCDRIENRFRVNDKISTHAFALGNSARTEKIYFDDDGTSTFAAGSSSETIKFVDATEFYKEHKLDHIDLVKLNIEGGEYELLEHLIETDMLKLADHYLIQFHKIDEESDARRDRIRDALSATHEPVFQYEYIWESWARKPTDPKTVN